MHQIVCRLGIRSRPYWGAYSAPLNPHGIVVGLENKRGTEGVEGKRKRKMERRSGKERERGKVSQIFRHSDASDGSKGDMMILWQLKRSCMATLCV